MVTLGRALSAALADQATASDLLAEIEGSPFVEHRIPLLRVLRANSGSAWVSRLRTELARLDLGTEDLIGLRDLELYFPIAGDRERWSSTASTQVAIRHVPGNAFSIIRHGEPAFEVLESYVPDRPTLVIGPTEVDYDDESSAVRGGERTGETFRLDVGLVPSFQECQTEKCSGGGGGGGGGSGGQAGDPATHTRVTYFWLNEHREGLLMGLNEIEIFGSVNGEYKECARFTEITYQVDYAWNPANPLNTIATAIPNVGWTVAAQAYEDDDGACDRNDDDDFLGAAYVTPGQFNTIVGTSSPGDLAFKVKGVTP